MSKQKSVDIYSSKKKGKKGKAAAIIIIIVLVLLIAAAAWVWFFNRDLIKDFLPQEETQPATVGEVTTAEPTTAEVTTEPETIAFVEVPNVNGYAVKDAYYKLNAEGLRYTVVREYSDEIHLDYVISQEPEAGNTIRSDERVVLHVSKGYDNQPAATVSPAEPFSTEPTQSSAEKEDKKKKTGGKYILDGSDKRIITRSEVLALDNNEMTLALNEIFARHGRKFNTPSIQAYFDKQSWYKGTISAADFDEDVLSATERTNVNTILSVMEEKGYR